MNLRNNSRNRLALSLCLGLSITAFSANAHEVSAPSASSPDASQPDGGNKSGMQHHYHHKDGYKGHHGNGAHPNHHGMGSQGGMHHGMGGQGGMHHGMGGYGGMSQGPMMELGLDDEQLVEIAEIQQELRSELQELKVERYEESLKLEALYAADDLDAGDINDQQQRVFDVIKEITELQVEAQKDIRDLLTSEQKNRLARSGGWLMLN